MPLQTRSLAQQDNEEEAKKSATYAKRWGAAAIAVGGIVSVIGAGVISAYLYYP